MKHRIIFVVWTLFFLLALCGLSFVAQGLVRDFYTGDPIARIKPRSPADWQTVRFRVWGHGVYALYIESVNHDEFAVGRRFGGTLAVRVIDPSGASVFERTFTADALNHRVPLNFASTEMATITLDDWPLRRWGFQVRVVEGDSQFKTAMTRVRLRKQRYDPGMGGLMNYAMIVPTGVFILITLALSIPLARAGHRGGKLPLALSASTVLAFLILISGV